MPYIVILELEEEELKAIEESLPVVPWSEELKTKVKDELRSAKDNESF